MSGCTCQKYEHTDDCAVNTQSTPANRDCPNKCGWIGWGEMFREHVETCTYRPTTPRVASSLDDLRVGQYIARVYPREGRDFITTGPVLEVGSGGFIYERRDEGYQGQPNTVMASSFDMAVVTFILSDPPPKCGWDAVEVDEILAAGVALVEQARKLKARLVAVEAEIEGRPLT